MTETRFIHISDLHIDVVDSPTPDAEETATTLKAVREQIEALEPRPAFVIASGDLTNHGSEGAFRRLRELMSDFPIPVIWALGNHDNRQAWWLGMHDTADEAALDHEQVVAGVHIITLDSSRPGRIGGDLDEEQLAFLDAALDRHPTLPKLVVMHHAPVLEGPDVPEWHGLTHRATARLAEILPGRGVQGLFSGHIHVDRISFWHGIPVVITMGLQNTIDPLFSGEGIRALRGASMNICTLRDSGLSVTLVPRPSDRAELRILSHEALRAYEAALTAN